MQDIQDVIQFLDINEFRLFELAYEDWFGVPAREHVLEQAFIPYLFAGDVPCWVRQYTRYIRQLTQEAGVIACSAHQVDRFSQVSKAISKKISEPGLLLSFMLTMLLVVL